MGATIPKRFNRHSAEKKLEQAWRDVLNENGLIPGPAEVKKILREVHLSHEAPIGRGLTIGMSLGLGGIGKALARKVKTETQLEDALTRIREAGEKMPTAIRKATKELGHALPRRGGPGRQPKLTATKAAKACDQIGLFVRQGHTVKEALKKVAELTPSLFGKKVGARTLQKAWDKRSEYLGNDS
jgi:hypothetical protein